MLPACVISFVNRQLLTIEQRASAPVSTDRNKAQDPDEKIPELSVFKKVMFCIPVVGFFASVPLVKLQEEKINPEYDSKKKTWSPVTVNPQDLLEVTKAKIQLRKSALGRSCASLALIIAAIATGTLSANFLVVGYGIINVLSIPVSSYHWFKNATVLNHLENDIQNHQNNTYRLFM